MTKKKIKRRLGDIVSIELDDGSICYGRVLAQGLFAFYELRAEQGNIHELEAIVSSKILFTVPVMDYAVKDGIWPVIGNMPLEPELMKPVKFYKQDPLNGKIYIYDDSTGEEVPATKEECQGLECEAAWEPEHIQDRLRDHYAGVPNIWVEDLAIK